jgi:hypothetical protein
MIKLFLGIFIVIFMASCSTTPNKYIKTPTPNPQQQEKIAGSLICKPTALPSDSKKWEEWRYGCFCGESYPGFKSIDQYYTVKPKDHIDIACRNHDVCWETYGENDGVCNEEFLDKINFFEKRFQSVFKEDNDPCANVVAEISTAFDSPFVKDEYPDNPNKELRAGTGKKFSFALVGIRAFLVKLGTSLSGYPDRDDKCNISDYTVQ